MLGASDMLSATTQGRSETTSWCGIALQPGEALLLTGSAALDAVPTDLAELALEFLSGSGRSRRRSRPSFRCGTVV
jgi:hypothetical protein